MEFNFTNDCPIYIQLADQIVAGILAGEYKPGDKLPSVREFAVIASVNPNTAQRALAELETAGLIDTMRNTGKFVTGEESAIEMARQERGLVLAERFIKGMAALGYSEDQTMEIIQKFCKMEEETHE